MRIWEHTFEKLTGGKEPHDADDMSIPMPPQPFVSQTIVPITHNPKYATALLKGESSFAHQVLLELNDGKWMPVGSYVDDTIHLDPHVRGMKLGEELLLRCAEHRQDFPLTTNFSKAGYKLLKRTHRLAVERAQESGLPVPQAVLDEIAKE